ncbi:MAG: GNAT family N-acetyltransferase [Candidatus Symbiothrix sp.]|jgi:ribosomal protein S18 acetylase RimI-like enzyme|nr:GNAT family N-acetyltransferase [Candidatus Symbiothrix sp.]
MTTINITLCDYSNPVHLQAIASLINSYINDEMGGGKPLSKPEQLRLVEGLKNHPKSIVLLAETDDNFVGLLTAFENFSTFTARPMVNIHDVFVLKEYRGKGIGRQLMNAVINEAEKCSGSRISLEVRQDNGAAQNLYKSLGFEETEPSMFYWRKYL